MSNPKTLFSELRRRRVFNTIVIYIIGAWVAIQAVDLALPGLDKPQEAIRYAWYAAIALFPLVLVFAWRFDVSAQGIHRTPEHEEAEGTPLQRPDRALIGGLGAVAVAVVTIMALQTARYEAPAGTGVRANSIAVLTFSWCGGVPDNPALASGIHAEVISRMAAYERLKVKGRNSMYQVASLPFDQQFSVLGVQYLLSGELCRDGGELLLFAELTDREQAVVWSGTFKQHVNADNRVEQDLSTLVAAGVAFELGAATAQPRRSMAVHPLALEQLRIGQNHRQNGRNEEARAALEQALELEPEYAEAIFELALVSQVADDSIVGGIRKALPEAERALALARDQIERGVADDKAHYVVAEILWNLSYWQHGLTWRTARQLTEEQIAENKARERALLEEAERHLRAAIRLSPQNADHHFFLSSVLTRQGPDRYGEALEVAQLAREIEPFHEPSSMRLATALALHGQAQQAMEELERWEVLGEMPGGLRWQQMELQQDDRSFDDKLALLLEILSTQPERAYGSSENPMAGFAIVGNLYWMCAQIAKLGMREEATRLYRSVEKIPDDEEFWVRWLFLRDMFVAATAGKEERLAWAREQTARIEGLSAEQILDRGSLFAWNYADELSLLGDFERAIAIHEGLGHIRNPPRMPWRDGQHLVTHAWALLQADRADEAVPIFEEIVHLLQEKVDNGVRHPAALGKLAIAYARLGQDGTALDLLEMAIDYGNWWAIPQPWELERAEEFGFAWADPWQDLRGDPRFEALRQRGEAIAESQRQNIRALLAEYDIDALLKPIIEQRAKLMEEMRQEQAGS